jgi:hypothetical protein
MTAQLLPARGKLRHLFAFSVLSGVLRLSTIAAAEAVAETEPTPLLQPEAISTSAVTWTAYAAAPAQAPPADFSGDTASNCDCYNNCCPNSGAASDWWTCPIRPSDHCFDDFISPMSNPVYFEDPRTLTEARFIFLNHKVPNAAGGGDVQLYALQIRAALTDRLSLIATKDGYVVSSNPLIDDGWADVAAGLKYNLYSDPCTQQLLSAGLVYEAPAGTHDTLQGNGDGAFDFFLTGGAQICPNGHWLGAAGLVQPVNDGDESTWSYFSNHFDYYVGRGWYALMEYNWYHYLESGDNGIPGVEGGDLFNFGSTGVAGNNIVTCAFGAKFKPDRCTEIGIAWEVPLTERRDVLENRLTFDYIRRF